MSLRFSRRRAIRPDAGPMDPIATVRRHDAELVPDERAWGQGFGADTGYTPADLDEIEANMRPDDQFGYHTPRLFTTTRGYHRIDAGRCVIPPGHDAHGPGESPNRPHRRREEMDGDITTSAVDARQVPAQLQRLFGDRGWVTDQHGRPCHPWHEQLMADTRIGLNSGIGYGHWWGESMVVDAVLFDGRDHVLLVGQHTDPDPQITRALPGGYAIPADEGLGIAQWRAGNRPVTLDGIYAAARRRLEAETGVSVPVDADWRIVRAARPVSWPHTTLHFWITAYTVSVQLPEHTTVAPRPGSGAAWHRLDDLGGVLPHLWRDHQRGLTRAVALGLR